MRMQVTGVDDKITKVTLNGRLDTPGVGQIETLFVATLVPAGKSAIVDLSDVEFVASLGIRMLMSAARGMRQRQAKLALYNVCPLVREVFDTVALSDIIPIGSDEDDARRLVSS
jgi:anti-sigma B factor antagonist